MSPSPDDKKDSSDTVKVELGAVAKAEAAARYERKTQVSITVPEDITRAKADAFLDTISPFTQALGSVGDWIGDTRERLRAQRLEALSVIGVKARKAIELQAERPRPIPIKALLPILDRASLEDASDDTLTTAWGALIASASLNYDHPEVMAFSRILSELSPRECIVLERIFGPPTAMRSFFESEGKIKPLILDAVMNGDATLFAKLREFVDDAMPLEFTVAITRGVSHAGNLGRQDSQGAILLRE